MSSTDYTRDVVVQVTDREDGGIRVLSRELPGLLLGGRDHHRVWSVVGAAVESLLRNNDGMNVLRVIGPMTPPTTRGDVVLAVEYMPEEARAAA